MNNFTHGIRLFAGRFSPIIFVITLLIGFTLHSMADDTFSGNALSFDGANDYVNVTQNNGLPIYNNGTNNAYTICLWVKGGAQNDKRVFSEGSGSNDNSLGIGTGLGSSNKLRVYIRDDGGTTQLDATSSSTVFDNFWHHVAWVDNNGTATLYIDGRADPTNFNYTRGTLTLDKASIGALLMFSPSYYFLGQIDEVRIWNVARTQTEIRETMYVTLDGTESGLVGYWPFDEGSGTIVEDIAGGNDGTLHGGVRWITPSGVAPSAGDLLQGEVLHMEFDKGSGNTVIDWAEGNDGTIEDNADWVDGRYSGALYLDGETRVTVPNAEPLTRFSRSITVAVWVKLDEKIGSGPIVGMSDAFGWALRLDPQNLIWWYGIFPIMQPLHTITRGQ